MPTPTYVPLANITLSSPAATVTFSSISQAYGDLVLVVYQSTVATVNEMQIYLNSDTGSNYNRVYLEGNGSATSSNANSLVVGPYGTGVGLTRCNFMGYSATDKHKTFVARADSPSSAKITFARWASNSAITSIACSMPVNNWSAGTSFALYGIAV
jgi:hypothetical protein